MTKSEKIKSEKQAIEKLAATAEQLKKDFAELFHVEQSEMEYENDDRLNEEIVKKSWNVDYHMKNLTGELVILQKLIQ